MPGIEVFGLTKVFGTFTAVGGLSFNVEEGEVLALLGPNGAGKTTTIRMLSCLITPTSGRASVAGYDVLSQAPKVRSKVGILPESPSLYERLTATENLEFFAKAYGVDDPAERRLRISHLLEILGLWERRNDRVATFSKGMKQKLAFARAVLHRPPILFLDEPTSNLDPVSAKLMRDEIRAMSKTEGRSILLSTHRLEDVEKLSDKVLVMKGGRLIAQGTPEELEKRKVGGSRFEVLVRRLLPGIQQKVLGLGDITDVKTVPEAGRMVITCSSLEDTIPKVVRLLVANDQDVLGVKELRDSLEEAYLELVGEGQV